MLVVGKKTGKTGVLGTKTEHSTSSENCKTKPTEVGTDWEGTQFLTQASEGHSEGHTKAHSWDPGHASSNTLLLQVRSHQTQEISTQPTDISSLQHEVASLQLKDIPSASETPGPWGSPAQFCY